MQLKAFDKSEELQMYGTPLGTLLLSLLNTCYIIILSFYIILLSCKEIRLLLKEI